GGTNCAVNDVDNVLNATEQTELRMYSGGEGHAHHKCCNQGNGDYAAPVLRPLNNGIHSKKNSIHTAALLRSFHPDLTAPDASSGSSGVSARPFGKRRASCPYDSNNAFSSSRLRK